MTHDWGRSNSALDQLKLFGMTNTSRWSTPKKPTPAHDDESLPEGWQNVTNDDGTEYFWNTVTDQTTMQRPDYAASADVDSAKLAFDHSPAKGAALAFVEINNADGGPSTSAPPPGASMETAGRPSWQRNLFARKKAMAEPDLASGPTSGYWPPKRPVAPDALRNGFKQVLMTNAVLTRVGVPTKPPPPPTMASRMHDFHQQYDPTFDVALWQWQQGKWVHLPGEAVKSEAPRELYRLKPAGDAAGAGGTPAYWEAEVRRLFETVDTDGDGVISSAECRAALETRGLTKAQVASFMAECRNSPINEVRLEEMLIAFECMLMASDCLPHQVRLEEMLRGTAVLRNALEDLKKGSVSAMAARATKKNPAIHTRVWQSFVELAGRAVKMAVHHAEVAGRVAMEIRHSWESLHPERSSCASLVSLSRSIAFFGALALGALVAVLLLSAIVNMILSAPSMPPPPPLLPLPPLLPPPPVQKTAITSMAKNACARLTGAFAF